MPAPETGSAEAPAVAGLRRRCLAGGIDLIPSAAVVVPLTVAGGQAGFLAGVALVCAYFAVTEARYGRSLGKRLCGLRVLQLDGEPCTTTGAVIRNGFRVVDGFPGCYLVALVSLAGSRRGQRIGDQAAGTSVYVDSPELAALSRSRDRNRRAAGRTHQRSPADRTL
jgi:uncharacterized RDD family membrane protein YckC